MRSATHTQQIGFRAHPKLVADAEAAAAAEGMSLSELLRTSMREAVRRAAAACAGVHTH